MSDKNKIRQLGEVYILLRMSCELKCKICPYWGGNGACNSFSFKKKYIQNKRDLINVEDVKSFVDQISRYKPKMITLSGGEPLMFEGWIEIAKHIKNKGIKVSLSTNGLHIKKFVGPILEYVDSIQLNLGGTKEIISKTRVADYGFDLVIENIRTIAELKKRKKQQTPFVRIIYVVSDLSYRHIAKFYDYFKDSHIEADDFYFQHLMYSDRRMLNRQKKLLGEMGIKASPLWQGYEYKLKKVDTDFLIVEMKKLLKEKNVKFSPQMSETEIKNYYDPHKKAEIKRNYSCQAPWEQVDLYPNGDIMTCPDCVIGNIFENSFETIWNGDKNDRIRRYISGKKEMPACRSCFYYYASNEKYKLK